MGQIGARSLQLVLGLAMHSSVPWKDCPLCPPPALPPAAAVQPPVTFSSVRVLTPSTCKPPAVSLPLVAWNPHLPSGEGWGKGVSASLGGAGAERAVLLPSGPGLCSSHNDCLWLWLS